MRRLYRLIGGCPLMLGLAACETPSQSPTEAGPEELAAFSHNGAQHTTAGVFTHPSRGPVTAVAGARATLVTNDAGARMLLHTEDLQPGHAYTVWVVIFNRPEGCAAYPNPCTSGDVLFRTGAVLGEVVYGTGHVVGGSGQASFAMHVSKGDVPRGWFGNGFTNPRGAEVHLVLMDHGPAIPGLVSNQISTLRGGCTDASVPGAFPPVAHADGIPGPNTCRLFQFTILRQ